MAKGERRTKGSGTVYQLPSGRWNAQGTVGGNRRSKVAETRREAEKILREMLSQADRGIFLRPERVTVAEWLERWLSAHAKAKLRPETHLSYALIVRVHLAPAFGHLRVIQLQRAHL